LEVDINKNPLVSVIINCYNSDKYLNEAIDSVYNQTYENWEIIFWDNQSTDNSAKIAQSYDNKVKYFYAKEHTSLGAARNEAVKVVNGQLISFLDCDDLWLPKKLDLQIKKIISGNYSMCYGGCIEIDENGNRIRSLIPKYDDGNMFEDLLFQWNISTPAILVKKSDLEMFKFNYDKNIFASVEYDLFMQLASKTNFCSVKEPIVKWRIRNNSLTSQQISRIAYERRYTLDKIIKKNPGIEKKYQKGFDEAYARSFFYDANYFMSIGDKKKARNSMRKIKHVDYKYRLLFFSLFFPSFIWNFITNDKIKRKFVVLFSRFF
jgi:glycosyltransferase involved in cell wall biosynthesis